MYERSLRPHRKSILAEYVCLLCTGLLLLPHVTRAQTNWVSGTAYGTNTLATAVSIASVDDGPGSLIVGFDGTTDLSLNHDIEGFIVITNKVADFSITATTNARVTGSGAAALTILDATNLTVAGGRFVGTIAEDDGDFPPLPGLNDSAAAGGLLQNSSVNLNDTDFTGADGRPGLLIEASDVIISNGVFSGGGGTIGGAGLLAVSNSTVTVHGGSFTGRLSNTAFYLQDSDAAVYSGDFTGNVGGEGLVYGDGLFSQMSAAATNTVELYGGTFSSLAFWGVDGSVLNVIAGTNLVVLNGIAQSNGTVVVDNRSDEALQDITVLDGIMQMQNDFVIASNGTLRLLSADAQFDFAGNLLLGAESSLSNGLGRTAVAGSFTQSSGSILSFSINAGTNGMLAADSATFESNATLRIDATQAAFSSGTTNIVLIETLSGITGTNNLTIETFTTGRSVYDGLILLGGNDLAAGFTVEALKDYWGATGQFALLADELEAIGNDDLINAIDAYDDPEQSSKAIEETYFTTFNNFQTALQGMRAAVGQSLSRGSEFREQLRLTPSGARGPERNNQLRGWAKYYGRFYTRDRDGLNPEYDTVLHGGTVGIDTSIENLLLGISGGSSQYRIDRSVNARSDTVAYHGSLYGTYGFDRGYIDAGLFYGHNQVDTRTADPFRLDGSFDANVAGGYLSGGYDLIDVGGRTIFTPEASLQYAAYEQDAYTETGSTAVPRAFNAFDADSILSSIGMNVSMLDIKKQDTFRYKADLRLHWMHEFNPDPDDLKFILEGGSNLYPLAYPSLDEDLFRVGIGCSFFNTLPNQPQNVIFRIDFDELFGDGFNSHNLTAKVIYAF
jgi:hypothetical protein